MTSVGRYPIVALTGHRRAQIADPEWVKRELLRVACKLRDEHGTTDVISGMALGADTWWAQAGLRAGLDLHSYVPFPRQAARWKRADQSEHNRLVWACAVEVVVVEDDSTNVNVAYHARNEAMIEAADMVVSVWDPAVLKGGTYATTMKTLKLGKPVLHVDPTAQRTRWLSGATVEP